MTSCRITEREIQAPNGLTTQVLYWTADSAARSERAASFYKEAEDKNRIARKLDRYRAADVFRSSDGFVRLRRYDGNWSWRNHGLTGTVISVLTTPFGWLTDEVVLWPALLFAAMCIFGSKQKFRMTTRLVLVVFGFVNWIMLLLIASKIPLQSGIYFEVACFGARGIFTAAIACPPVLSMASIP